MDEGIRPGLKTAGPSLKDLRVFGLGLGCLLAFFGFLAWRKGSPKASWEMGAAALSAVLALFRPAGLLPVYKVWMPAALFLGKANTFLFLSLFYYLIITPYALLLRLCGMEMLDLRFKDRDSYWRAKEPSKEREDYQRQF
jgi:hypothetical protein